MTKKQKIEVLKKTAEYFANYCEGTSFGLCYTLERNNYYVTGDFANMSTIMYLRFPELLKYKPKAYDRFWFPRNEEGTAMRLAILLIEINILENE